MALDFNKLTNQGIQNLVPYKPGKSIEELAKESGLKDIIKLASNENPLGCSLNALAALRDVTEHWVATYPSPANHPLLPKLAAQHKLPATQLLLSNGSDSIFGLLLTCFALGTGKSMLTHEYAFNTYEIQAHALNIPVHKVVINPGWQVDVDKLIQACNHNTGIIFIANPNNPTGKLIPAEDIQRLLSKVPTSTIVVLDEAYHEFVAHTLTHNSLDWLAQYPNLVITRTFSKIYGLAGLRLGYAIGHEQVIAILQRVQLPFNVNQAALQAASAAIDDEAFVQLSLENNVQGMEQIRIGLAALDLEYITSTCNFISFDCKQDASALYNFLLQKGIIVRPLHPYHMNNYIRVSIGTKEQNTRFLQALASFYNSGN